jgi:hypothetical protein
MEHIITGRPFIVPVALIMASFRPGFVGPGIREFERIRRLKIFILGLNSTFVEQQHQPGRGIYAEVIVALDADAQILFQFLLPDDLTAALALDP